MATATETETESRLIEIDRRIAATQGLRAKKALRAERARIEREGYATLSALERVRLARHPERPQTLDYIDRLIGGFIEIHGDRRFADDRAIVAGFGTFGPTAVAVVGHQRGRTTEERIRRNFGKPHPEGYRKAGRTYELASRFNLPLLTFIDTQGAEPGAGAEERGQAEAIARNLELMARLEAPVIASVIGEGGSRGALALGVANIVLIQEYACYSVITPEGCAAILWRGEGPERVADAAAALKLSAPDLKKLGIVDEIVAEPPGGAHRDPPTAAEHLGVAIRKHLDRLLKLPPEQWRRARERKFRSMGVEFLAT